MIFILQNIITHGKDTIPTYMVHNFGTYGTYACHAPQVRVAAYRLQRFHKVSLTNLTTNRMHNDEVTGLLMLRIRIVLRVYVVIDNKFVKPQ